MTELARRHRLVCKGGEVPPGWVVLGEARSEACPGDGANAWIIARPGARRVVCLDSPVPEGYRRVRRTHGASCPGDGDNAWLIERDEGE